MIPRLALPAALATCGYLAARLADTRRRLDTAERWNAYLLPRLGDWEKWEVGR